MDTSLFFQKSDFSRSGLAKKVNDAENYLSLNKKINPYYVISYEDLYNSYFLEKNVDEFTIRNIGRLDRPEDIMIDSFSPSKFASNLKTIMQIRNFTRSELAKETKISIKSINAYLEKKRKPNIEHLIKISNVLKINIIFLIK